MFCKKPTSQSNPEKLVIRGNYHFVDINKELEKYPNKDLPELFKKMDELGLEKIKSIAI